MPPTHPPYPFVHKHKQAMQLLASTKRAVSFHNEVKYCVKRYFYHFLHYELLKKDKIKDQGKYTDYTRVVDCWYIKNLESRLQHICYSHWANGDRNGVISIRQWGMFNHEKGAILQSHLAAQKEGVVPTIIFSNHKTC